METVSCMQPVSTCGVFRTRIWSWGRPSSAPLRRQTHGTLNSAGSWSLWNLRSLWKQDSATTLGYVWRLCDSPRVDRGYCGPVPAPWRTYDFQVIWVELSTTYSMENTQEPSVGLTPGVRHSLLRLVSHRSLSVHVLQPWLCLMYSPDFPGRIYLIILVPLFFFFLS